MKRPFVLAAGELLWDLLPAGRQLGGAPANMATHALRLGADAALVSRVGCDALGDEAVERLAETGLPTQTIQRDAVAPTGTAAVTLDRDGQPRFVLASATAWDNLVLDAPAREAAARADAVCFGTLAQRSSRSRDAIRDLLAVCPPDALRVLDLNLRDPFWTEDVLRSSLGCADVLKVNEQELDRCAGILGLSGGACDRVDELCRRFRLQAVAVTRGADGSLLCSRGRWDEHPGVKVTVRDAVGAGDAFTAALTLGLLRGDPLDRINRRANELGAYVCTRPGATPRVPDHLVESLSEERR
jgi:fructokinase